MLAYIYVQNPFDNDVIADLCCILTGYSFDSPIAVDMITSESIIKSALKEASKRNRKIPSLTSLMKSIQETGDDYYQLLIQDSKIILGDITEALGGWDTFTIKEVKNLNTVLRILIEVKQ